MNLKTGINQLFKNSIVWIQNKISFITLFTGKDLKNGLKMAGLSMFPLFIFIIFKDSKLFSISFLGVLFTSLADPGGLYHVRLRSMILASIMLIIENWITAFVADMPVVVICLIMIWTFSAGMLNIFGGRGIRFGSISIISFILFTAKPVEIQQVYLACIVILTGSLWICVLKLCRWPFRPYQPLFNAAADYYRELKVVAISHLERSMDDESDTEKTIILKQIEMQRIRNIAYLMIRDLKGNYNLTVRHIHLLLQKADLLFKTRVALSESIKSVATDGGLTFICRFVRSFIDAADLMQSIIERSIQDNMIIRTEYSKKFKEVEQEVSSDIMMLHEKTLEIKDNIIFSKAYFIIQIIENYLKILQDIVKIIDTPVYKQPEKNSKKVTRPTFFSNARILLIDNLTISSPVFRHSLRICVTLTISYAIIIYCEIPYGYWIPITAAIILKPDFNATKQRAIERVGGTAAGGIVAIIAAGFIHNKLILFTFIIILIFLAFANRLRSYCLYAFYWTPVIILLIDYNNIGNWDVALERILYNLTGGILALIAIYHFLPKWERYNIPDYLTKAISANRHFGNVVLMSFAGKSFNVSEIEQLRQEAYREYINLTAAFERFLKEPDPEQVNIKSLNNLIYYNQRLCNILTALSLKEPALNGENELPWMQSFIQQFNEGMQLVENKLYYMFHEKNESKHGIDRSIICDEKLFLSIMEDLENAMLNKANEIIMKGYIQVMLFLPGLLQCIDELNRNSGGVSVYE